MDQAEQLRNIIKKSNSHTVSSARVITVTSGKGGVGKSNLAINLAIQLRKQNKRVIIFDADFGLANIEVMFGAIPRYNLSDLIYRGKSMKEIITSGPLGIGFVSGGSGIAGLHNLTGEQLDKLLESVAELDSMADVILIDTGAGISDSVLKFVRESSEILLITTSEPTSITDAYSLLKILSKSKGFMKENAAIKIVANKVETMEEGELLFQKLNVVVKKFLDLNLEYIGAVPEDTGIPKAVISQVPISIKAPNSKASRAFEKIAARLSQGRESQSNKRRGMIQLFSRFVNKV